MAQVTEYVTDEDIEKSYNMYWRSQYPFKKMDVDFNNPQAQPEFRLDEGILKQTRKALSVSSVEMAKRLNITRESYYALEKSEFEDKIGLHQLRYAAIAMDCDLIYYLRPVSNKRFSRIIWDQIYPEVINHPRFKYCTKNAKPFVIFRLVERKIRDFKFRKTKGFGNYLF